jgi:quercetin dioxygenase-like cupin family protein
VATGVVSTVFAKGTMSERVKVSTPNIKAKFKKPPDFIVQENVIDPGGSTGWHSHPGPALVIIEEGTFTCTTATTASAGRTGTGPGSRSSTRAAATSTSAATRARPP